MRQEHRLHQTSPYPVTARVSRFLQVRPLLATMRYMFSRILLVHPF
jgi:hypothetical protein